MSALLDVEGLRVEFGLARGGTLRAVDGVSFRIGAKRVLALVGESGSGKTVIAQAILRILPSNGRIAAGAVRFRDPSAPPQRAPLDLVSLPERDPRLRAVRGGRISMVFQEPTVSLSPLHTVGNQVSEAVRLHRDVSRVQARELARAMLAMVGFAEPARAERAYPFELSGGLRQRAMIAMALVSRPALLIADEPTTALDVTIQAQTLKLLRDLQAELGMAVLLITHDLGVVANLADEVAVLYRGRLVESGTVDDIFSDPQHPYLIALMNAVPRVGGRERLTPVRPVDAVLPRGWGRRPEAAEAGAGDALLRVEGVAKTYALRQERWRTRRGRGGVRALDGVSFELGRGECLGLVGESGCGKTTLSRAILRAVDIDEGAIAYNDRGTWLRVDRLAGRELARLRRRIQLVFQDPYGSLNPRMTVLAIVGEPLLIHGMSDAEERAERVRELIELVGLEARHLSRYPHSFSGGQRQRIGIARALALGPELLVCDEPVSALDVSVQAQVLNLLRDIQAELGLTYLFISHNLAVVDYMAQRVAVMCAGRIVELAPREALFQDPRHPYTRTLLAAVPRASLADRLDFDALVAHGAADPETWPAPYGPAPGRAARAPGQARLVDVGDGHLVAHCVEPPGPER